MPRFEIITSALEVNKQSGGVDELFKTTMTHNLTGSNMLDFLQSYGLLDWVEYAEILIRNRNFGIE